VVKAFPIPQTLVLFSGPGLKRKDPDFYAAYVLNYILGGGGFSSRLMDDIREKRGLTYGIGTGLSVQEHFWRWTGSASTKNESASEVVKLIKEDIGRLGAEGPTEKEVADAKAYLTGAYPLGFDSNTKIAGNLMQVREDDLGVDYIAKRNSLIEGVTLADLKRVAAQYMKPEAYTFVEVGQPK
jgi:zinc protease